MTNSIRNNFRSNEYLFFIWFKLYRSNVGSKISWFNKNTELYFDGYPRSGNTFMSHLMKGIYDDNKIVHHFHSIAPLKIALKRNVKSIIIIRNPEDAISSNYLKKLYSKNLDGKIDTQLLQMLINDYIIYYKYVKKNRNKLLLIEFTNLVSDPENTLLQIDRYLKNFSNIKDKVIFQNIIKERKFQHFGDKRKLVSSLPNKDKEILKELIKVPLRNTENFIEAKNIFDQLT